MQLNQNLTKNSYNRNFNKLSAHDTAKLETLPLRLLEDYTGLCREEIPQAESPQPAVQWLACKRIPGYTDFFF